MQKKLLVKLVPVNEYQYFECIDITALSMKTNRTK